jgi:hypothetical protein
MFRGSSKSFQIHSTMMQSSNLLPLLDYLIKRCTFIFSVNRLVMPPIARNVSHSLTQLVPVQSFRISGFDPPPARVFAWHVLELKEQGVSEDDAMAVADAISSLKTPFCFLSNTQTEKSYSGSDYLDLNTINLCYSMTIILFIDGVLNRKESIQGAERNCLE